MTGEQTLMARGALGVVAAVATVLVVRWKLPQQVPRRTFDRWLLGTFLLSRLGLFLFLFVTLHLDPRGDVVGYYVPEGLAALRGHLPYRDYESSYAPLHGYMDAAILHVWGSAKALILFAVLVEFVGLPLWIRLARRVWTETDVRRAALLYLVSPLSLQFCAIDGQDNVVIATLVAAGFLLIARHRQLLAGALFGLSVVTVKLIPLGYIPVVFVGASRRWRWLMGVVAISGVGYGMFAMLLGRAVLFPVKRESGFKAPGGLPYLVEGITGWTLPGVVSGAVLVAVSAAILLRVIQTAWESTHAKVRMQAMVFGMVAITLALELFARKSWPAYLMLVLFPLLMVTVRHSGPWTLAGVALFNVVAMVEHSYWATVLGQFDATTWHKGLTSRDGRCFFFLVLEILLVAGYGFLLRRCWRQIKGGTNRCAALRT